MKTTVVCTYLSKAFIVKLKHSQVAELVDAEIILSEIQWCGESPRKILVTHYKFESCPDYNIKETNMFQKGCRYEMFFLYLDIVN